MNMVDYGLSITNKMIRYTHTHNHKSKNFIIIIVDHKAILILIAITLTTRRGTCLVARVRLARSNLFGLLGLINLISWYKTRRPTEANIIRVAWCMLTLLWGWW